jgi:predicted pyridoxine 5'-phosphate oxidase superfamily flavin-nucleotide-binding protein
MSYRFGDVAFTPGVKQVQAELGSRAHYARVETARSDTAALGPNEREFIGARDSLYMATVSETGWPYVQHRGGPPGFVQVLNDTTIGFADFRGNRQYVSVGNLRGNDRVALILVDYPGRQRLKLLGRAALVEPDSDQAARLATPGYVARIERAFVITVVAFDWNCPQHITPRFTEAEVARAMSPLRGRIAELEKELAKARSTQMDESSPLPGKRE